MFEHPDISVFQLPPGGSEEYADNLHRLITSPSQQQLDICKTETGITRSPLILGLNPSHCLGIPHCMSPTDAPLVYSTPSLTSSSHPQLLPQVEVSVTLA
jgi:hypothetical protein